MAPKSVLIISLLSSLSSLSVLGQNVVVNPSASQSIVQPVGTTFAANRIDQDRYADQFMWTQTPSGSLSAGSNTVTLTPCPQGVNGTDINHWLFVTSASGDAQQPGEQVLITGGTCTSGASTGTLTFYSGYAHGAGYVLGSGTNGVAEAVADAATVESGNDEYIHLSPIPVYTFTAPLYVLSPVGSTGHGHIKLIGESQIYCTNLNQSCVNLGDTNSLGWANGSVTEYPRITLDGIQFKTPTPKWISIEGTQIASPTTIPGTSPAATITYNSSDCPAGFWPLIAASNPTGHRQILWLAGTSGGQLTTRYGLGEFVEVTGGSCTPGGSGTIVISQASPGVTNLGAHGAGYSISNDVVPIIEDNSQGAQFFNIKTDLGSSGTAGSNIQIDNDQEAISWGHFGTNGSVRCDIWFCGAAYFAPGPFSINAGIINVYSGNFTNVNGAWWFSGNDLVWRGGVVQAFPNFAFNIQNTTGGFGKIALSDVHREPGGTNPNGLGEADIISGFPISVLGTLPNTDGRLNFLNAGGTAQYYYLVGHNSSNVTVPIPFGYAYVTNPNTNNVTVKWPSMLNGTGAATSWDLLRSTNPGQVPYSTGNFLVASGITPSSACNINGVCSYVDNVASPTSYTVVSSGTLYYPDFSFWPGGLVLAGGDSNSGFTSSYQGQVACTFSPTGSNGPTVVLFTGNEAGACVMPNVGAVEFLQTNAANLNVGGNSPALILPSGGTGNISTWPNMKGRINFGYPISYANGWTDLITIFDSNPQKTWATTGLNATTQETTQRPLADANDATICVDNSVSGSNDLCARSKNHFDIYTGVLPVNSGNWAYQFGSAGATFTLPITTNSQITSTLAVGTPPFVVSSTTPVVNLTTVPATFTASGVQQSGVHIVQDSVALASGTASVTLSGSAAYSSSTSYTCNVVRSANTNTFKVLNNSATKFTITSSIGTDNDTVRFVCVGS
jgi:hypothetical protein